MDKELVGRVTHEEKQEIQILFERRNGLNELKKIIISDNTDLYEKLVKDIDETSTKFRQWWNRMGEKYQWKSTDKGNLKIDFKTNEIYLITK